MGVANTETSEKAPFLRFQRFYVNTELAQMGFLARGRPPVMLVYEPRKSDRGVGRILERVRGHLGDRYGWPRPAGLSFAGIDRTVPGGHENALALTGLNVDSTSLCCICRSVPTTGYGLDALLLSFFVMYPDLETIANLEFGKAVERISRETRERMQNALAGKPRGGAMEQTKLQFQLIQSEVLELTRKSGRICWSPRMAVT